MNKKLVRHFCRLCCGFVLIAHAEDAAVSNEPYDVKSDAGESGQPVDENYARDLLEERQDVQTDAARSPAAGDEGGWTGDRPTAGADQPEQEKQERMTHKFLPGDQEGRKESSSTTGPVTDPFAAAASAVTQAQQAVHGVKEIKEEVEDF